MPATAAFLATQAAAGDISASAIVSQPFSSAKVSASASAASVPVANIAPAAGSPGAPLALHQRFGRDRKNRREQQRQARERQRSIEPGDAIVERDEHGERHEPPARRPQHRRERARRTALRHKIRLCRRARSMRPQAESASRNRSARGSGDRGRRSPAGAISALDGHVHRPVGP